MLYIYILIGLLITFKTFYWDEGKNKKERSEYLKDCMHEYGIVAFSFWMIIFTMVWPIVAIILISEYVENRKSE